MDEVLIFINNFRKRFPEEMEKQFTEGYCYWFAHILKTRFKGRLYYLPIKDHFVTKIKGVFYDITGIVDEKDVEKNYDSKFYSWDYYKKVEPIGAARVKRYAVDKLEV